MGFSSYTENIIERLNEAQRSFQAELSAFRIKVSESDFQDRDRIAKEIGSFKKRLNKFLDELEKRSKSLFEEAIKRLGDGRIDVFRHVEKKEFQTADARKERNEVVRQLDNAREATRDLLESVIPLLGRIRS